MSATFFDIDMQSMIDGTIQFLVDLITSGLHLNEKKKKNLDNCSWPSRTGILQSSQTKAAILEE